MVDPRGGTSVAIVRILRTTSLSHYLIYFLNIRLETFWGTKDITKLERIKNYIYRVNEVIVGISDDGSTRCTDIIFDQTKDYFQVKYHINKIETIGLLIGSKERIYKFLCQI